MFFFLCALSRPQNIVTRLAVLSSSCFPLMPSCPLCLSVFFLCCLLDFHVALLPGCENLLWPIREKQKEGHGWIPRRYSQPGSRQCSCGKRLLIPPLPSPTICPASPLSEQRKEGGIYQTKTLRLIEISRQTLCSLSPLVLTCTLPSSSLSLSLALALPHFVSTALSL